MTVVLAEDDVDIRDLVQIVLEGLDLSVTAVGNGAEALAGLPATTRPGCSCSTSPCPA